MSDPTLFRRAAKIVVGTTDISGLDVAFNVKKTLNPNEPNTCDLKVWNLSPDTRKTIESGATGRQSAVKLSKAQRLAGFTSGLSSVTVVPVLIEAGYVNQTSQIFLGELRTAGTITDGADLVTELTTGDGDQAIVNSRLNVSMGPGTLPETAMRKLVAALGIGEGNLAKAVQLLKTTGSAQLFVKGAVLKGSAADHMTDLCRGAGLEWSIQDGQLQVLSVGQPLDGQAVSVTPNTGMIGSPTVDTKGILNVTTLIIPSIRPGVKIAMNSRSVKGGYRVISCEYTGDTMGNEWYCKIEADRY